jgi:hypothetical protein
MEGIVEFSRGMQTQDRYLFLFSDLLLVAKQKYVFLYFLGLPSHFALLYVTLRLTPLSFELMAELLPLIKFLNSIKGI